MKDKKIIVIDAKDIPREVRHQLIKNAKKIDYPKKDKEGNILLRIYHKKENKNEFS